MNPTKAQLFHARPTDWSPSILSNILLGPKSHRLKFYCLNHNGGQWRRKGRNNGDSTSIVSRARDSCVTDRRFGRNHQSVSSAKVEACSLQKDAHPHFWKLCCLWHSLVLALIAPHGALMVWCARIDQDSGRQMLVFKIYRDRETEFQHVDSTPENGNNNWNHNIILCSSIPFDPDWTFYLH